MVNCAQIEGQKKRSYSHIITVAITIYRQLQTASHYYTESVKYISYKYNFTKCNINRYSYV